MRHSHLSQDYIKSLFDYDPETGNLIWCESRANNRVKVGDLAGTLTSWGYIQIRIDGKRYFAHQLVYLYHHGYIPDEIDHWDEDRSNNRIGNLLDVTRSENQCKKPKYKNNTSGFKGVYWAARRQKWHARINKDGRVFHLGYHDTKEVAAARRREAAVDLHGEFARF